MHFFSPLFINIKTRNCLLTDYSLAKHSLSSFLAINKQGCLHVAAGNSMSGRGIFEHLSKLKN